MRSSIPQFPSGAGVPIEDLGPFLLLFGVLWRRGNNDTLTACVTTASKGSRAITRSQIGKDLSALLQARDAGRLIRRDAAAALHKAFLDVAEISPLFKQKLRKQQRTSGLHAGDGPGGFLLTSSRAKGVRRRATEEFVSAVGRYIPELSLKTPGDGGTTFAFLEAGELKDSAQTLGQLFRLMMDVGDGFRHVEHVVPFDGTCAASPASVANLVQRLVRPALSTPTTIAIVYQSGGHHAQDPSHPSRGDYIAAIGAALPRGHSVDLRNPELIIHVRGFSWRYGVCVRSAATNLSCPVSREAIYTSCSEGQAYYRRGVNDACVCVPMTPVQKPALPDTVVALESWLSRISAACPCIVALQKSSRAALHVRSCDCIGSGIPSDSQVSALVKIIESSGFRDLSSIEFGAGRGTLTKSLHTSDRSDVVRFLIDRDRAKGGTQQHTDCDRFDEQYAMRLRIDIRNLWLGGLPELQGRNIVGIGKHVCGAATDYALRCLCAKGTSQETPPHRAGIDLPRCEGEAADALKKFSRAERKAMAKQIGDAWKTMPLVEQVRLLQRVTPPRVAGIAIALCCHHLCTWESYVNHDWLDMHGISPVEFRLICQMSSWGVSRPLGDLAPLQEALGRACKGFLDAGRKAYLIRHGFQVELCEYCSEATSMENRMILANRYCEHVVRTQI